MKIQKTGGLWVATFQGEEYVSRLSMVDAMCLAFSSLNWPEVQQ